MRRFSLTFFLTLGLLTAAFPQNDSVAPPPPERDGLKINLNQDGSHFFQVTFLNQTWLRYNENNPGSTLLGTDAPNSFDIGLRRTRIQMFGQVTRHAFVYFQFGQNNFNFLNNLTGNRKISAFFHDALCEFKATRGNELKLGGGLTITNGLSRFSQPSVGTILTLDVPVFAQATVDQTDEFSRKLSVYARGQIGKLDYRFSLSNPFPITSNGKTTPALSPYSNFTPLRSNFQYQTYLTWQFWDKEPHTTPYMTGTYLGKKKVLNLSAGAIYQKDAMWRLNQANDTLFQNMLLLCAEAYLDMPLNKEKGTALSAYAGFFNLNFGTDYLRYNGIMNPASGGSTGQDVTGAGDTFGNAFPMMGTGQVIYSQVGFKFPDQMLGKCGTLLPYASWMHAEYDRLGPGNGMDVTDLGINWLLSGHKAKIAIDWQSRPTYFEGPGTGEIQRGERRNALILLYQIFI